jgi:hypothetical protein
LLVPRADGAQGARQRDAKMKGIDQRGIADGERPLRQPAIMKIRDPPRIFVLRRVSHEIRTCSLNFIPNSDYNMKNHLNS